MPPTPQRLHDLLLACGFDPAQLERITQQSMGTGLDAITTATDPVERARAIVDYATRYGLIRELTATVLTAGSDKPVMQNVLLDDNMSLDDGRTTQSTAIDLVRLEGKVERIAERVNELANVVTTLSHAVQAQNNDARQPIQLGGKAMALILFAIAALVTVQISVLAFLGMGQP